MQDLLTVIASSSNPRNALRVLRRLAVSAPDEARFARADAVANALAREVQLDFANDESASYDKRLDWYIGQAMAQLVEGEADEVKCAQFRDIKEAFARFYDEDGEGDPWQLLETLDFIKLTPAEFNEAKRIADRLDSVRAVLNDAKRLADKSPAARDVLAPTLSVLEAAVAEGYELGQRRLRPAVALQDPPHMTPRGFMDALSTPGTTESWTWDGRNIDDVTEHIGLLDESEKKDLLLTLKHTVPPEYRDVEVSYYGHAIPALAIATHSLETRHQQHQRHEFAIVACDANGQALTRTLSGLVVGDANGQPWTRYDDAPKYRAMPIGEAMGLWKQCVSAGKGPTDDYLSAEPDELSPRDFMAVMSDTDAPHQLAQAPEVRGG